MKAVAVSVALAIIWTGWTPSHSLRRRIDNKPNRYPKHLSIGLLDCDGFGDLYLYGWKAKGQCEKCC